MIEEKVWGRVTHVVMSPELMVSVLEVKAGTFCSVHRHIERVNQFQVISGVIGINRFGWDEKPGETSRMSILRAGDQLSIPELEWHQFMVEKDGVIIEVYHPADCNSVVRLDDIERYSEGGRLS